MLADFRCFSGYIPANSAGLETRAPINQETSHSALGIIFGGILFLELVAGSLAHKLEGGRDQAISPSN